MYGKAKHIYIYVLAKTFYCLPPLNEVILVTKIPKALTNGPKPVNDKITVMKDFRDFADLHDC